MKSGRVFWGVFFIGVGMLVLFRGALPPLPGVEELWKFWPAAIVLIGLAILLKNHPAKMIPVVLAAVLLALIIAGLVQFVREETDGEMVSAGGTRDFTVAMRPETREARLSMNLGAARAFVGGRTESLLEASTVTNLGEYDLTHEAFDSSDEVSLDFHGRGPHFKPWKISNRADVRIHDGPLWDISVDCGAARLEMDLREHRVGSLDIEAGASSIDLSLGGGVPETRVNVEAGASSVRIGVPAESGCEVRIEGGLTSKDLDGFEKMEKGVWQTANYANASERVLIDINAGVSRITVRRQ